MPLYISFQEHLLATQTRSCLINVHPRSYRKKSVKYDISLQIDNNTDALKCNQGICHSSYKNQSLRFRMTVELMNNILLIKIHLMVIEMDITEKKSSFPLKIHLDLYLVLLTQKLIEISCTYMYACNIP